TLPTRRSSDLFFPINLFTEEMVLAGLVIACLFAGSPTFLSTLPLSKNATIEGVVLLPSLFCITTGSLPSITATQEFVVPKSIPIIFPISLFFYSNCYFVQPSVRSVLSTHVPRHKQYGFMPECQSKYYA